MEHAVTLVQITDSHLHAVPEGTLLGMNTENSLKLIIERVQQEVPSIDLVIATGDIAQDSSEQAYHNFLQFIAPLQAPMRWIPGNHDSRENMQAACAGLDHDDSVVDMGDWVVILLDSSVPGKVYGELAQDQLNLLEQALATYATKHALVSFHHHSIDMNSQWIDQIGIRNRDDLKAIIDRHSNVKLVVCGHVHQDKVELIDGVHYISTPSTCVQFKPESEDFGIDNLAPGYRTLTLNPDGSFETVVSRIEDIDFEIDFTQKGY